MQLPYHTSLYKQTSIRKSLKEIVPEISLSKLRLVSIDQTNFYQDHIMADLQAALNKQKGFRDKVDEFLNECPNASIGYFGLAHIPFVFYAGYLMNRCEVQLFVTDRSLSSWKPLSRDSAPWPQLIVDDRDMDKDDSEEDIVIRVSVSYSVKKQLIESIIDKSFLSLHLYLETPFPDTIISEQQLNDYTRVFYHTLVRTQQMRSNSRTTHIFFSGPPTLAFRLGQQISTTVDRDVLIYNFSQQDRPNYGWAVDLKAGMVLDLRNKE